jgi:hypothetical protein
VKTYHTTRHGPAILRDGFTDALGRFGTTREWSGVWLADQPVGTNEGASGEDVLLVSIPEAIFVAHEWVQEPSFGYREALIPAALVNQYPRELLARDESQG